MLKTDVLVIGSGIAGLSVAIKVAQRFPTHRCLIITKQESAESNTRYAQGGIAVVSDFAHDSFEEHIRDTLTAGDGLCDVSVVEHVVHQAPERLRELIEMGADFDRSDDGELILGREGGHKANRIIHHRDVTGLNISTALLEKIKSLPNVAMLSHHLAIDLITTQSTDDAGRTITTCHGVHVLDVETNRIEQYRARHTVLATGGAGQVFETTTNPTIATGDGIAMAYRAGASISHMEFVQFHPTAFYEQRKGPAFLISEAVRGEGAYLRNHQGERFMFKYHIDGELACRDVVSRAIASEIRNGDEPFVYLDCTHIPQEKLLKHFPNIYETCQAKGIDITKDYIPVAPAAHYLCGGIDVNLRSRTTIDNLYACGECSNTGLHGANRLASNSLLEATVFAHECFKDIERLLDIEQEAAVIETGDMETFGAATDGQPDLRKRRTQLQTLMSKYVGIVRDDKGLAHAKAALDDLETEFKEDASDLVHSIEWYELRNLITCAKLIVRMSIARKENKGGFFNRDLATDEVVN